MTEATLHECPHDVYKTPGIALSKILTWIFPFCSSSLCKTQHLCLENPLREESSGLQLLGLQRVGYN